MRPPATIAFTLTGLALFTMAALTLAPEGEPQHEATSAKPAVQPAPARLASREPKPPPEEQPREETGSIRSIAPSVVAVPPFQPRGGLTREAPRRSLASLAPEPRKPEYTKLFRPVASAAGRLNVDGRKIEIAGIGIIEPGRMCEHADRTTWPCGMQARTAFRAWLRGRAVDCRLGSMPADEPVTTDCRLDGEDMGAWLVGNGWARAAENGPYAKAGKHAENGALGIFARK